MRVAPFADEFFALRHAEPVLLINDDEAEIGRSKPDVSKAWVPMNKAAGGVAGDE
jgi:hypothetical protein